MSDEFDWDFADKDDAKAEIRAAVEYLLRDTTGAPAVVVVAPMIGELPASPWLSYCAVKVAVGNKACRVARTSIPA